MFTPDATPSLPTADLERLTEVVEAFDRAWREGTPRLEDFLAMLVDGGAEPQSLRAFLFAELLDVEIEYRRRRGETPSPTEYLARFPQAAQRIELACLPEREREQIEPTIRTSVPAKESLRLAMGSQAPAFELHDGRIGPYTIEGELGRGGMGVVYLARRPETNDLVAIKTLLPSCSVEAATRFRREGLAMSKIKSDHVVPIYVVSEDRGRPYFVMPFIAGGQLLDLITAGPLDGMRAARLLEPVARALGELHRQGVLHRDLKPSNILYDRVMNRALLTDFGLAKIDQPDLEQTQAEAVFGTPNYMAPEQTVDAAKVTVAADIYGLGATLYHLITGQRLFHGTTNLVELMRMIREVDPKQARSIQPSVSQDLDAICQKCLEKAVERRYRSADELADELRSFLEGKPVLARSVSTTIRLARWCRRNRLATAFTGVVVLGLFITVGLLVATLLAFDREKAARARVTHTTEVLKTLNGELEREVARNQQLINDAEGSQYDLILDRVKRAFREGRFGDLQQEQRDAPALQTGWELQRLRHEATLAGPVTIARLGEHDGPVLDAVLSPDGQRLVTCGAEGLMQVWNTQTNRPLKVLLDGRWVGHPRHRLHWLLGWKDDQTWPPSLPCPVDLEWLGTTSRLAVASLDGRGLLIDSETAEMCTLVRDTDSVLCVAASADASRVLFGHRTGRLSLCDPNVENSPLIQSSLLSPVLSLQFLVGTGWLAGSEDGRVTLLDAEDLHFLAEVTVPGPVWSVNAAINDGDVQIVVASQQPRLSIYKVPRGESPTLRLVDVIEIPRSDTAPITAIHSARFNATAREICAVDQRGRVLVWSRDEQRLRWATEPDRPDAVARHADVATARGWPFPKPLERAGSVAIYRALSMNEKRDANASVGTEAIICSSEFVVRRLAWQPRSGRVELHTAAEPRIAFDHAPHSRLWCLARNGRLSLIDSTSGQVLDEKDAHAVGGQALTQLTSSSELVTVGLDGVARSWRANTAGQITRGSLHLTHDRPLLSIAPSPACEWLASVDDEGTLLVRELPDGRLVHCSALSGTAQRPLTGAVAFDATGGWLAALGNGSSIAVFRTRPFARVEMPHLDIHGEGTTLAWSAGQLDTLLVADTGRRLMVRNVEQQTRNEHAIGNWRRPCVAIVPSPDRRRNFLLTDEGQVEVSDARRHRSLFVFNSGPGEACDLAVDANGQRVAVAFRDGRIDVWETRHSTPSSQPMPTIVAQAWAGETLHEDAHPLLEFAERAAAINESGAASFLALRGENAFRELVYFEETSSGVREEIVTTGGLELSSSSFSLTQEANGQPVVLFRGGHDYTGRRRDKFDFDLLVARRSSAGVWQTESTGFAGNVGRYPHPVIREGRLERILCYCEQEGAIAEVSRTERGWRAGSFCGRQGDGVGLQCGSSAKGVVFTFNSRPDGAIPSLFFAGWFDGADWRREVVDPGAIGLTAAACRPDGMPVVIVRRPDQFLLATRAGANHWNYESIPGLNLMTCSLCIDRGGLIRALEYRELQRQLVLFERHESGWTETIIDRDTDLDRGWAIIRLDAQERPVILACNPVRRPAWVRVYRQNNR